MANKKKYYVVWEGRETGVFNSWDECKKQIDGFAGAKYKSYKSAAEAEKALELGYEECKTSKSSGSLSPIDIDKMNPDIIANSLCVDAACSGNPGVMEYRGVYTASNTQVFIKKFELGTNNIGEFLAIVHGLAYQKQHKMNLPIYTDSKIAIGWVKAKACKSKLVVNDKTKYLYEVVKRAEHWLKTNTYKQEIIKWNTKEWGEIPADFGRK